MGQLCASNSWRYENIIDLESFPRNDVGSSFKAEDGSRIGYAEYGYTSGDNAINLLLIPGFPGSRLFFPQHIIPLLKKNRLRFFVIEAPGSGLSSPIVDGFTYLSLARRVLTLADGLGIGAFHLIGYSAGTPIATTMASLNPSGLLSLTLIGPIAPPEWQPACGEGKLSFKCKWFMLTHCLEFVRCILNCDIWCFGTNPSPAKLEKRLTEEFDDASKRFFECNVEAFTLFMESVFELKARNQSHLVDDAVWLMAEPWGISLEDIQCATLIVSDEDDHLCPVTMARYIHTRIPGSGLSVSRGYGHCAFFPALVQLLSRFQEPFNKNLFLEPLNITDVPMDHGFCGKCCFKSNIDEDRSEILSKAFLGG